MRLHEYADGHDLFFGQDIDANETTNVDMTLEPDPLSVASVLRRVQASANPEGPISITIEVDESLFIDADETTTTLAVTNLLRDAVRFSDVGECILMRCRAADEGVIVEVEDPCGGLAGLMFPPARPSRKSSRPPPPHC
jgi:signal transduction histidine kinase